MLYVLYIDNTLHGGDRVKLDDEERTRHTTDTNDEERQIDKQTDRQTDRQTYYGRRKRMTRAKDDDDDDDDDGLLTWFSSYII